MSVPTTDHTLDEILNLAALHFKVPREKLTPDDDFFKTLGIDSLQALDLLTRLEHHFRSSCRITNCRAFRIFGLWRIASRRGCEIFFTTEARRHGEGAQLFLRFSGNTALARSMF